MRVRVIRKPKIEALGHLPLGAEREIGRIAKELLWPEGAVVRVLFWPRPWKDYKISGLHIHQPWHLSILKEKFPEIPQPQLPYLLVFIPGSLLTILRDLFYNEYVRGEWRRTLAHEISHLNDKYSGIAYQETSRVAKDWYGEVLSSPSEIKAYRFAARLYPRLQDKKIRRLLELADWRELGRG